MVLENFRIRECDAIRLDARRKMSDRKPKATAMVSDGRVIGEILALLARLPEKGEEMIKMGDVPTLEAHLSLGGKELGHFTFFAGRIKAPDTAFYSKSPEEEGKLLALLEGLLSGKC
jgi:hypothetical protein